MLFSYFANKDEGKSLNPDDRLSVTTFESTAQVIFPLTLAPSPSILTPAVSSIQASGGTNILSGILACISHLRAVQGDPPLSVHHDCAQEVKKNVTGWSEDEEAPAQNDKEVVAVQKEDMSKRVVLVMLLSDGETEMRDVLLPTTLDLIAKMPDYQV
jgi:hypothetical protein